MEIYREKLRIAGAALADAETFFKENIAAVFDEYIKTLFHPLKCDNYNLPVEESVGQIVTDHWNIGLCDYEGMYLTVGHPIMPYSQWVQLIENIDFTHMFKLAEPLFRADIYLRDHHVKWKVTGADDNYNQYYIPSYFKPEIHTTRIFLDCTYRRR